MSDYRDAYYPGTEQLGPSEMRVTALGTGMPNLRPSQMSCSYAVELGNGDVFLFDLGTGSMSRFPALGLSYERANKLFLTHLHTDHMGDFLAWYVGGWIEGRQRGVRVWGPSGTSPELGTKHCIEHLIEGARWDIVSRHGRLPASSVEIEVNEFDYTQDNEIVYDENGVVVRSWPAVHFIDGPISYSLEWEGLKLVVGGDTAPNKWYVEHAKGADLIIHECFITIDVLAEKFGFPMWRAIEVGARGHTSPLACGVVFREVAPRHAIAYHFFNDHMTAPKVLEGLRANYDGGLSLAKDLMVWNVTKDQIIERFLIPNPDTWPVPPEDAVDPSTLPYKERTPLSDWVKAGEFVIEEVEERIQQEEAENPDAVRPS
ncbi:MAG: MBL fold metallo-hydrolase [Thermoleophilia bacterium]|nr:MBL fold metallo-hydrolase [Thermoleophilia bacterium]